MPLSAVGWEEHPAETLSTQDLEGLRDEMRVSFEHLRAEFERLEATIMAIQIKQRGEASTEQAARISRLGYICLTRGSRIRSKSGHG